MFKKYMHVERLGSDEVAGILNGECYVFPKIDGTNSSVWIERDETGLGILCAGSRNRRLSLDQDNAGFYRWVQDNEPEFRQFFLDYPELYIYGEWLVPHTLKTYRKEAWRNFYVFDVYDDRAERYLPYDEYSDLLHACEMPFPVIAPIEIVTNPTEDHLLGLLNRNTYLIDDGQGAGEGIVIKRYDYVNQWGRAVWAKLVRNEFKERNQKEFGTPKVKMSGDLEMKLAEEYVTRGRVTKVLAGMREGGPVSRKRIPELFGRVWHDVVTEEMWEIIKSHKNPVIDFGRLYSAVVEETKRNCPELFG